MKSRRTSQSGAVTLSAVLLLAAGVYLALRSWAAVDLVLSPPSGERTVARGRGASSAERAGALDLALKEVGGASRDPFHPPLRPAGPVSRHPSTAAREEPPVVRLILIDQVNPEVQLSSAGGISGRLRTGQSFEGWTITSITQNAVVVTKDGITHTLTLRRQP